MRRLIEPQAIRWTDLLGGFSEISVVVVEQVSVVGRYVRDPVAKPKDVKSHPIASSVKGRARSKPKPINKHSPRIINQYHRWMNFLMIWFPSSLENSSSEMMRLKMSVRWWKDPKGRDWDLRIGTWMILRLTLGIIIWFPIVRDGALRWRIGDGRENDWTSHKVCRSLLSFV